MMKHMIGEDMKLVRELALAGKEAKPTRREAVGRVR